MLESIIRYFSPATALKRQQSRAALAQMQRFYDAGSSRPRNRNWRSRSGSANAALEGNVSSLIDRSRDLRRNNAYANHGIETIANAAVGDGIAPKPNTGNASLDAAISDAFMKWCDVADHEGHCPFYSLQMLAADTILESGSVIVRQRTTRLSRDMPIPLELQLLEPDQLDDQAKSNGRNRIFHGIEINDRGKVIALHLLKYHPNEVSGLFNSTRETQRVPIENASLAFRKTRPGQLLGAPLLAPVAQTLRDLEDYEQAELVRKKVEACFVAFVTAEAGDGGSLGAEVDDEGDELPLETVSPGIVTRLKPGEDVKFGTPSSIGGYADYQKSHLMKIASGINLHYPLLSGDLSAVNYSSFRAGDITFKAGVKRFRKHCLIPMFCNPAWRWFVDAAMAAGLVPAVEVEGVNPYGVIWTPPGFVSIDPVKDTTANVARIRARLTTTSSVIREEGGNPDDVFDEASQDRQALEARDLLSDAEPAHMSRAGAPATSSEPTDEEDDDDADITNEE